MHPPRREAIWAPVARATSAPSPSAAGFDNPQPAHRHAAQAAWPPAPQGRCCPATHPAPNAPLAAAAAIAQYVQGATACVMARFASSFFSFQMKKVCAAYVQHRPSLLSQACRLERCTHATLTHRLLHRPGQHAGLAIHSPSLAEAAVISTSSAVVADSPSEPASSSASASAMARRSSSSMASLALRASW